MLSFDPEHLPFKKDQVVLDLGCGDGRHISGLLEYNKNINIVGVDIAATDLQRCQQKLHTWFAGQAHRCELLQANAQRIPFADNSFDHIICSEVLEHIENYHSVLDEIRRVLKDDGYLCITVPRAWPEKICWLLSREYHQVEGGHLRIFNRRKLQREVGERGLTFYKRHWAHALHSPYWWLKCLFWKQERDNIILRAYHKLLVWDLMQKPRLTRWLEKCLNPLCGKSVVLYFKN